MQCALSSIVIGFIASPLFLAVQSSAAQSSQAAAAPASAIVTITFSAAVMQTNEAQNAFNALKQKYAPREAQLKSLSTEVDTLKKQLDAAGDKLSETEREQRAQVIDTKDKQLQRGLEDYKSDSQADSQEAFQTVAQKLYTFLQTYAHQKHYTVVIERGSAESPIVWYADGAVDITNEVAHAYNAQSGAALPAAPAPGKGSAKTPPPGD